MTTNPAVGRITSTYGARPPIKLPTGKWTDPFHAGADIANERGTPIRAVEAGRVVHAGLAGSGLAAGRSGLCVIVKHRDGTAAYYGHLDRVGVALGADVTEGQVIGAMGDTGNTNGVHLHFEWRYDARSSRATVDPVAALSARGITLGIDLQEDDVLTPEQASDIARIKVLESKLNELVESKRLVQQPALKRIDANAAYLVAVAKGSAGGVDVDEGALADALLLTLTPDAIADALARRGLPADIVATIGATLTKATS